MIIKKLQPATFSIILILLLAHTAMGQAPRFGNGYENLTRRTTGGKVRNGDTIDIKMAIHIPWGYNGGTSGKIFNVRFVDSIPSKTIMLTSPADSIRMLTNEDVTYLRYTPAGGDDAASYDPSPAVGQYQIKINLGATPTAPLNTSATDITGTSTINLTSTWPYGDKPKWYTGHIFSTSFRVKVTGSIGDTIVFTGGKFIYKLTSGSADVVVSGIPYKIVIGNDDLLCASGFSTNYAGESNGTFGTGNTLNRAGGPSSLVPDYGYTSNVSGSGNVAINDGYYGIVNNISPWSGTSRTARRVPNCSGGVIAPLDSCKYRMFGGNWEVEGDHTGSTGKWGNNPPAAGTTGGYMLLVNADYITSDAYEHTVNGLCPNTFYQFSAWFRNVCRTCGADNNLTGTNKPGVMPSLSFAVNGIDYYSTGELDTTGWVQKAFLFKTGPSQSSAVFSIRNNSQGGGGNDWAIDDINIATCGPSSSLNYQPLLGCSNGTLVALSDTVRYKYNNLYAWYKWERSTDGGNTWGPTPALATGNITPTLVNGMYQFITNYPPFLAYAADSGHRYRVVVATSESNLSSTGCSFADPNSVLLKLIDCSKIVDASIIAFSAKLDADNIATLNWQVSTEVDMVRYDIEKSGDGNTYTKIGAVNARNANALLEYFFTDPQEVTETVYYRLKIINTNGTYKYSRVILINKTIQFQLNTILNPFTSSINADLLMPQAGLVNMYLYDSHGKLVAKQTNNIFKGLNSITYNGFDKLSRGMYIIRFENNNNLIQRKITKIN